MRIFFCILFIFGSSAQGSTAREALSHIGVEKEDVTLLYEGKEPSLSLLKSLLYYANHANKSLYQQLTTKERTALLCILCYLTSKDWFPKTLVDKLFLMEKLQAGMSLADIQACKLPGNSSLLSRYAKDHPLAVIDLISLKEDRRCVISALLTLSTQEQEQLSQEMANRSSLTLQETSCLAKSIEETIWVLFLPGGKELLSQLLGEETAEKLSFLLLPAVPAASSASSSVFSPSFTAADIIPVQ
ncbi:MAG: hypothetical protein FJZ58_05785 [Chlamydiae bacterium]|jgi:hypothetical protein|nr:hypothetical protein [Chlamydiota bacterium]